MKRKWARDLRNEDLQAQEVKPEVPEVSPEEQQRLAEAEYWRITDFTLDELDEHRGSRW